MQTTRNRLTENWRFKELEPRGNSEASDLGWMPAEIPGYVHLDLQRNGVIPDPFYRLNERTVAWVDETDWVYECEFEVEEVAPLEYLRFEGLDTIAEISLNGAEIGRTDNMFIPHEFRVDSLVRVGTNTLRIVFRSALRVGRERQAAWQRGDPMPYPPTTLSTATGEGCGGGSESLARPDWFVWGPRSFVRKAQYMFGWDWGPELVSCGIWQQVERVSVPNARIEDWRFDVQWEESSDAVLRVEARVEATADERLRIVASLLANDVGIGDDPESEPAWRFCTPYTTSVEVGRQELEVPAANADGRSVVVADFRLSEPRRWQPRTGAQSTSQSAGYMIVLALLSWEGESRDGAGQQVGLAEYAIDTEPDPEGGSRFAIRVNGELVFCKGANWIPVHSFPCDGNADGRTRNQVRLAAEAGVNMLRVWGGGLYESEEFYNACDEHGILVWQDFPYGCAYYPDSGPYAEAARIEAEAALKRIGKHPCLALLCGNNENHPMWCDGWERQENRAPRFLGEKLYHDFLPEVAARICPHVPYWPGSPFGGDDPNGQEEGDRHNWDVWHGRGDWPHYREDRSRFVSEFGFASSCGLAVWELCLDSEDRWPRSPAVRWHDKTRKGYETYLGYIGLHFPEPRTLEDLVYYSQLNQAEALKCGVEHWRRQKGRCWGTLFWQWNDCWPVQSWSVIDSGHEPKAAYYFAKRFYAPVLVSLVREKDRICAHLTNDLPDPVQGEVKLSVRSFDGEVLRDETFDAYAGANGTGAVGEMDVSSFLLHSRDVFVHARFEPMWEIGQERIENHLFLAEPKDLRLADPGISSRIVRSEDGGLDIVLSTRRFAPYTWLRMQTGEWQSNLNIQDNFFHLHPGEDRIVQAVKDLFLWSEKELWPRLRIRTL